MWSDRAPLGWDDDRPRADRPGRRARCCRTSSRRRPARSCTSTAASTRWAPDAQLGSVARVADVPASLVELRVLEGPNLYFPRAAIKLTLDITALAAAPRRPRSGSRAGSGCATPGRASPTRASGSGSRCARSARLVRAIAARVGHDPARRTGAATSDPHQIVVAYPWRHRDRAQVMGRAVAEVLDAVPGGGRRRRWSSDGGRAGRRRRAGPGADARSRPEVPVVAVTGTNGKTTTSRMIAHIARAGGRLVGWSNTDGIYIDGELVEAGDYSGPSGAGRVLAHPQVRARGHRDRPRRHPAQGHRADPQRRLGGHQRHRRPPRPAGHRHPRPARRGQGGRPADHPARAAGRCSTATTRGSSRCGGSIKAQPWVFSRDPDSPAIREVLDRRRPGHDRHRRLDLGARARRATPTRWSSWSTCR